MEKDVKQGSTLIVRGPTRVTLLEGKLELLGKIILPEKEETPSKGKNPNNNVIIVPSAISYPLYALTNSKLEIYTNNEENLEEISKNTISDEWIKIKDSLIEMLKKNEGKPPLKIMVLGISSGKTTLISYLANNFIREGYQGAYLDSDLGQQIVLPTTLMIGLVKEPFVSLKEIDDGERHFVGATFPKGNLKFIVSHHTKEMIENFLKVYDQGRFVLIDTDGWVKTEAGSIYKNFFIKKVDPDALIVFYDEEIEEYKEILKKAKERKDRQILLIKEENNFFYDKSKEERRFLRQSRFAQVFEEFKKITIPLEGLQFIKRDYNVESDEIIEVDININNLTRLPYHYVIVGLCDENSNLLNVGLLFTANIEKNYVLLFSDMSYKEQMKIRKIILGSLRLSTKGNHQGYLYL